MTTESKQPGGLGGILSKLFLKSVRVEAVRELGPQFRLMTLVGEPFQGARWTPGDKLQVSMGGMTMRTYSPISWDAEKGATELAVYLHGDAPGASWGRLVKAGDTALVFGPRGSLDLESLERGALLFGDETSFGVAHAIRSTTKGSDGVRFLFEVTDVGAATRVLEQLSVSDVRLVERKSNDAYLEELESAAVEIVDAAKIQSVALTGRAPAIQRLHKRLRAHGLGSRQLKTRAYWAPGKVGLD